MKKILLMLLFAFTLIANYGCRSVNLDNSYRSLMDVANHFADCGVQMDIIQPLMPFFGAKEGMSILIDGSEIGIYKFDVNNSVSKERVIAKLEDIYDKRYVYISGFKYPALINGTFILIGYDTNKSRNKIIEAFNSFE